MRKKILLLVNGAAGTGSGRGKLFDIVRYLTIYGCEVTAYPILPAKGIFSEDIIRGRASDFDAVVCCGGDGTLNHVVSGLAKCGLDIPIGYIPSGSTNDFARSLGIPESIEENCRAIAGSHIFEYDIGKFNDAYFNYIAAFGAFTKVSYATHQNVKNVLGYGAYVLNGILSLPQSLNFHRHLTIECEQGTIEGEFVFGSVSNTTSVGGMSSPIINKASLNDGKFEAVFIAVPETIMEMAEIVQTLTSGSLNNRYVRILETSWLNIVTVEQTDWTLDGEYGGRPREIRIEACPKRMKLLIPSEAAEKIAETEKRS